MAAFGFPDREAPSARLAGSVRDRPVPSPSPSRCPLPRPRRRRSVTCSASGGRCATNALLAAAGFGPVYTARALDDAALASVRDVIGRLLRSHAPLPALVLDAHYAVLDLNDGARALLAALGIAGDGTLPNLVTLLLGPLRETMVNHDDVVRDTQARLQRDLAASPGDARLASLLDAVERALVGRDAARARPAESPVLLTTFRTPAGPLHTLSALVHFGGARDATVQGLQVELMYPADARSEALLRAVVGG